MAKYDVVGVGNPLLDFIVEVPNDFLNKIKLEKGKVFLVDDKKAKDIFALLKSSEFEIAPGGSAANVVAGVGALGGKGFFFGSIGNDDNGSKYEKLSNVSGVKAKLVRKNIPTGQAITFITPDGERTFATYLGAALEITKEDIDENIIKESKILHIEGFQLEIPNQKEAAIHAMSIAKENNVLVSIDLADSNFILRNKEFFRSVVKEYADLVFVNKREAEAYTGEKYPLAALEKIGSDCRIAVVTLGEKGSIIWDGNLHEIEPHKVQLVNANGPGDMYDAAFLYGIANGFDIERAGRIASYAAAQVVSIVGARLDRSLKEEIKEIE